MSDTIDTSHAGADPLAGGPVVDVEAYLGSLEELSGLLLEEGTLTDLLAQVLELTSRAITASAAVSVTVVDDDGGFTTAASSSDEARSVDAAQYELDEGPCIEALQTATEQRFDDLTELDRWPRFRERADQLGFGTVLAVPLLAAGRSIGCLNVFAEGADALDEDDRRLARRIAAPAATTLANARAYRRLGRLADQLQEALDRRALVERAKGILIAHTGCDESEADARLRQAAAQQRRPVTEVAEELVRSAAGDRSTAADGHVAADRP